MWQPNREQITGSQMVQFMAFINSRYELAIEDYSQLYQWSIDQVEDFWSSFWDFSQIIYHSPYHSVVDDINKMPGAKWFEGTTLNFAENLLRYRDTKIAIQFYGEDGRQFSLTYKELYNQVSWLSQSMREMGIVKNDRVVGFMSNIPETVIAMLAAASIGAIWSSCSQDFGIKGVLDRFSQIKPKLIFAAARYQYNGKQIDCLLKLQNITAQLPSIEKIVIIPFTGNPELAEMGNTILWNDFLSHDSREIQF